MNREDKNKLLENKEFILWLYTPTEDSPWSRWYTESAHNRQLADELRDELRLLPLANPAVNDQVRDRIRTRIQTSMSQRQPNRFIKVLKWSAAAVVVGAAAISMLALNGKKTVVVGTGQQLSVVLPDGSQAKLNSGTTISYNTFLWKLSPKVKLEGEGYFYGKHTKGFDVATKAGEVTVLGTRFNVYSRNDSYRVHCFQGLISVGISGQKDKLKLAAGQTLSADLKNNKVTLASISFPAPSWTTGEFYYDKVLFKDVLSELERQFGVSFENKERFDSLTYSGYFNTKDIDIAFKMTLQPMGISYKSVNSHVVLSAKE